ncbi:MAG: hypothetical protein LBM62_05810 [Mediterranea sp.]|jgi:hypothetical protein|nr:hypothetical protein [Mediterranea sp.]
MNKIKTFAILSLLSISVSSCDLIFGGHEPEYYMYKLALNFQNTSGKDLVKGITLDGYSQELPMEDAVSGVVSHDEFTLNINPNPCDFPKKNNTIPDPPKPRYLNMEMYDDGYRYVMHFVSRSMEYCSGEKILTYELKCPYIFGDKEVHKVVTYWNILKKKYWWGKNAECYLIEFEGKEITPIHYETSTSGERTYAGIITLDKD